MTGRRQPPTAEPARLAAVRPAASRLQARLGRAYVTWRQFSANPLAVLGLVIILALLVIAIFAGVLAPHSPVIGDLAQCPAAAAERRAIWLGTDDQGRDIFSRLVYGSRLTLLVVVLVAIIAAPIGLLVGTVAGYAGGWVDAVLMRITDIFLAFPKLVLALAFVAALGPGIENAILAIAITSWPPYARIARAETLTVRNSDYIAAVRLMGASPLRIVLRHIMPLCLSSLIVRVTLDMAGIILTAAGLGFLGLGAQPPLPEWGAMIASGRRFILDQWWVAGACPASPSSSSASASTCSATACATCSIPGEAANERAAARPSKTSASPFRPAPASIEAVRGVSFTLGRERLGIVGECGSGKSQTGRAILGLTPPHAVVTAETLASTASICSTCLARRTPGIARQPHRHGPAGSEILAQPGDDHRPPDRRDAAHAREGQQGRGARAGARHAGGGADPRSEARLRPLSARGLRRHGPARHDRHDADRRPGPADRRRADLGARRHRAARGAAASSTSW